MITETKTFDKTFSSKCKNVKEGIKKLKDALEHIENHKEEKMEELYRRFEIFEHNALHRVCKHLSSEEVNAQFSSWTKQEIPPEYSDWEKTKRSIEKAFNSRLQETLQLWLKNDMLLTKAEGFLHEELKKFFDLPEDQSNCLPDDKEGDSPEINSHYRMQGHSGSELLLTSGFYALLTPIAWVFNPIASLAIRVGVAAIPFTLAALGLSAEGFLRLEARSVKSEFQQNKEAFMSKHSKDFLVFVEEKQVPQKYVKMQLTPVRQLIFKAGTNLSTLIPVERKQLSEFESEERSLEKVQNALKRIDEEGRRLRGLHALQGMKEMCPGIQISREALEWNDRISSRIGSGTFGDVYEGKMWMTQKESKTVALKVCKKELNDENASEIMDEIEMLR